MINGLLVSYFLVREEELGVVNSWAKQTIYHQFFRHTFEIDLIILKKKMTIKPNTYLIGI